MPRSVCVHPDHRQTVALALERNRFLTQGDLAAHLEIALSTVSNFCRGVNVSIAKFEEISEALGLEPRALLQSTDSLSVESPADDAALAPTFFAYDEGGLGRDELLNDLADQLK